MDPDQLAQLAQMWGFDPSKVDLSQLNIGGQPTPYQPAASAYVNMPPATQAAEEGIPYNFYGGQPVAGPAQMPQGNQWLQPPVPRDTPKIQDEDSGGVLWGQSMHDLAPWLDTPKTLPYSAEGNLEQGRNLDRQSIIDRGESTRQAQVYNARNKYLIDELGNPLMPSIDTESGGPIKHTEKEREEQAKHFREMVDKGFLLGSPWGGMVAGQGAVSSGRDTAEAYNRGDRVGAATGLANTLANAGLIGPGMREGGSGAMVKPAEIMDALRRPSESPEVSEFWNGPPRSTSTSEFTKDAGPSIGQMPWETETVLGANRGADDAAKMWRSPGSLQESTSGKDVVDVTQTERQELLRQMRASIASIDHDPSEGTTLGTNRGAQDTVSSPWLRAPTAGGTRPSLESLDNAYRAHSKGQITPDALNAAYESARTDLMGAYDGPKAERMLDEVAKANNYGIRNEGTTLRSGFGDPFVPNRKGPKDQPFNYTATEPKWSQVYPDWKNLQQWQKDEIMQRWRAQNKENFYKQNEDQFPEHLKTISSSTDPEKVQDSLGRAIKTKNVDQAQRDYLSKLSGYLYKGPYNRGNLMVDAYRKYTGDRYGQDVPIDRFHAAYEKNAQQAEKEGLVDPERFYIKDINRFREHLLKYGRNEGESFEGKIPNLPAPWIVNGDRVRLQPHVPEPGDTPIE